MALREVLNLPSSHSNRLLSKQRIEEEVRQVMKQPFGAQRKWWKDTVGKAEAKEILEMSGTTKEALLNRINKKGSHWTTRIPRKAVQRDKAKGWDFLRENHDHPTAESPTIIMKYRKG